MPKKWHNKIQVCFHGATKMALHIARCRCCFTVFGTVCERTGSFLLYQLYGNWSFSCCSHTSFPGSDLIKRSKVHSVLHLHHGDLHEHLHVQCFDELETIHAVKLCGIMINKLNGSYDG